MEGVGPPGVASLPGLSRLEIASTPSALGLADGVTSQLSVYMSDSVAVETLADT